MTRFQEEWLLDPNLKEWVVKVTNDETKVYCRWCSIVLRAHRSDLNGHSNTQKHAKNAVAASVNGTNAGPISVQIVQQDQSPMTPNQLRSPKKNDSNPMFCSSPGSVIGSMVGSTCSSAGSGRPQYTKKYRKEWEEVEELKSWLRPFESDTSKAYCRFCNCMLRAHKHDLVLHAKSSRHRRTEYARQNGISGLSSSGLGGFSDGELEVSNADSTENDLVELDAKRSRLDDIGAIEQIEIPGDRDGDEAHFGQISIMTTCEEDKQEMNVIKVEKADPNNFISQIEVGSHTTIQAIGTPFRRRKLNASKVIAAIQNNEFTGYELLQIVKTAVPKL